MADKPTRYRVNGKLSLEYPDRGILGNVAQDLADIRDSVRSSISKSRRPARGGKSYDDIEAEAVEGRRQNQSRTY